MGSQTHQAVTGSSTTIGSVLRGSTGSVGGLVTNPLTTQGVDRVKRTHTTSTDGNVTLGNVRTFIGVVRTQTRTTRGIGLIQNGLTATGGGRLENGHLDFLTSGVEFSSDSGEVGDGSGHASDVFDSLKIQEHGGSVPKWWTVPQVSSVLQFNHAIGIRHQLVHAVLLQLENHLRIAVRFAQTQECLNAVVAGHADAETTVHSVVALHQHHFAGGHAATRNQAGSVSVAEQVGDLQVVVVTHIAAAGIGVGHRHHHAVVGIHHLLSHPSGESVSSDGIQSVRADLIQQVAGLFYHGGALLFIPTTGGSDKGAEVIKASRVQQGIGLGGVHPVERPILQPCLVLDADRGSTRHGVRFVTGAAQVSDGLSEQVGSVEQGNGVVLIGDTRVMDGTVGLEGHV